jgi:transcription elongation factor Elf1
MVRILRLVKTKMSPKNFVCPNCGATASIPGPLQVIDAAVAPVKAVVSTSLVIVSLIFICTIVLSPIGILILLLGSVGVNAPAKHGVHCASCGSYFAKSQVRYMQPRARAAFNLRTPGKIFNAGAKLWGKIK